MASRVATLFEALQEQLEVDLRLNRTVMPHPVAKGDASELDWSEMLREHLPGRYKVGKGFVIDSRGVLSDQIDLIVYDNQYTPLLLNQKQQRLVPAESVYAVFEVKQTLNPANLRYAGKKAASVRRLHRTSAPIPHAGGVYPPRDLFPILGGILALDSSWKSVFASSVRQALPTLEEAHRIDIGCAVCQGSFEATYREVGEVEVKSSTASTALLHFFFRLVARLQALGTASAIDYSSYADLLAGE